MVDAENLPDFLGGKCKCEHVEGGCMYSQAGPWQDYEIAHPTGIKRKQIGGYNDEQALKEGEEEEKQQ